MYNELEQTLLSTREAAERLGYTHDYISKMCRHGYLKATRSGNSWTIRVEDLAAFKRNHEERLEAYKKTAVERAQETQRLSTRQAAKRLGYTHDYISKMCREGHIKAERSGSSWLIEPAALDAFKAAHEAKIALYRHDSVVRAKEVRNKPRFLSIACGNAFRVALVAALLFGGSAVFGQTELRISASPRLASSHASLSASVYESGRDVLLATHAAFESFFDSVGESMFAFLNPWLDQDFALVPVFYPHHKASVVDSHPAITNVSNYVTSSPVTYVYSGSGATVEYVQASIDNARRELARQSHGSNASESIFDLSGSSIEDLADVSAMTKTFGDVLYWTGSEWANIATSSLGISGSSFTFDYPLVESGGAVSLAFGTTTENFWSSYNNFASLFATNASTTNATTTNLHITSATNGGLAVDANGRVYSAATTTYTVSGPFTTSATPIVFGASPITATYYGLATTSNISQGQILYATSASGVASAATTTLSVGNGLTTTSGSLGALIGGSNASIGLAAIAANTVLANGTGASAVPTAIATSSLFAAGSPGNVLTYTSAGTWVPSATTTFSTGLTYSGGSVTVNTSQNIDTLSNLTTNGLIKTSGGTGALSIATAGTDYIAGGAGAATSTVTCSGTASCTSFVAFAASPITITGSGLASYDAWLHQSTYGATASATTTPLWAQSGLYASSTVAFGTAGKELYFNSTTGFLGIGTTTPQALFSVNTSAALSASGQEAALISGNISSGTVGSGPYLSFANQNGLRTGTIGNFSEAPGQVGLAFSTYNTGLSERVRITAIGAVGIGTTTPWAQLSINPNALGSGVPEFAIGSSTATHFVVDGAGKVGIGTSSPVSLLAISSASGLDGATPVTMTINSTNNGTWTNGSQFARLDFSNNDTSSVGDNKTKARIAAYVNSTTGGATSLGFFTSTNTGTVTEQLTINHNGLVGVGSTSPWGLLSVNPTALGSGVPEFVIGSSSATHLVVTGAGNVGIGIENPVSLLEVYKSQAAPTEAYVYNPNTSASAYARYTFRAGNKTGFSFDQQGSSGDTSFWLFDNAMVRFGTNNTQRLTILANGNVGIGSTTPYSVLSVSTSTQSSGTTKLFTVASTTGAELLSVLGNGDVSVAGTVTLGTSATVGGVIQTATADGSDSFSIYLCGGGTCNDTSRGAFVSVWGNDQPTFGLGGDLFLASGNTDAGNGAIFFNSSNGTNGTITNAGNFGINNTNPDSFLTIAADADTAATSTHQLRLRSSSTVVATNDQLGGIDFVSNDTNLTQAEGLVAASIVGVAEAGHTASVLTTGLAFYTVSGDGNVPANYSEKLRISADGSVGIGDTNPTEADLVIGASGVGSVFLTLSTAGTTNNAVCWDNAGATLLYDCDSTPADYAESYATKNDVEYGDIVMMTSEMVAQTDGHTSPKLAKAIATGTIVGIASDNYHDFTSAGKDIIAAENHPLPVALSGRVPVKVNHEGGPVRRGDYIALSSVPGVGKKANESGMTVGVALQDETNGEVLVFVRNEYTFMPSEQSLLAILASSTASTTSQTSSVLDSFFSHFVAWFADAGNGIGDFIASRVHTKEICVGDTGNETCITKAQLDALMAGVVATPTGAGEPIPPIEETPDDSPNTPVDTPPAEPTPPSIETGDTEQTPADTAPPSTGADTEETPADTTETAQTNTSSTDTANQTSSETI